MKKIFILAALALTLLGGCNGRSNNKAVELRIATPYGLGYSPVYVISELKLMEKYYPNVTLSVKRYGSSISLRNAALEANADILFSSVITPITLKDTGLNFKIAAGIGTAPYELMVGENSGIQSLDNFTSQNRIVLHGFASLPHLSIYVALNNYFDNYSIDMDNISSIIQTMADPVGYNSLLTGDVTALFTTIPYTEYAREKGFRSILSSRDVLGDISLVASVSEEYYSKYPAVYAAFYAALAEAVELINTRDAGALKAISKTENIPIGELLVLLEHEGLIFTTYIYGSMQMAEMLHRFGFIANLPVNIQDYMWGSASSMFGKERKVVFPPSQNKPAGEIDDEGEYEENGESSENGDYANGMEIVEE